VCAVTCIATTAANKAQARVLAVSGGNGTYTPCNYFDAYVLSVAGVPRGLYCSLYSVVEDAKYATTTSVQQAGIGYTIGNSFGYALAAQDGGIL